jgi:predicted acylesterase/phospholipase RssA
VICFLLCIGFTSEEIFEYLKNSKLFSKFWFFDISRIISGKGCYSLNILSEELDMLIKLKNIESPRFKDLPNNFLCASFNLCKNKLVYFSNKTFPEMFVKEAVLMSCAIPILFNPYVFEEDRYIDGGILDNFPIKETVNHFPSENVLGLCCSKNYEAKDKETWSLSDPVRLMFAASNFFAQQQLASLDHKFTIIPILTNQNFYTLNINVKDIINLYDNGYNQEENEDHQEKSSSNTYKSVKNLPNI